MTINEYAVITSFVVAYGTMIYALVRVLRKD